MLKAFIHLTISSIFLSCLITPLVCDLAIYTFGDLSWPFSRIFDRVAMICVLLMLIYHRKSFSLKKVLVEFKKLDFKNRCKQLSSGLILSLLSSVVVYLVLTKLGVLELALKDYSYYVRKLPLLVLAVSFISLIEESFFRVLCFKTWATKIGIYWAAILSSLLYASVHFIAPDKGFIYTQGEFLAGFIYLVEVFLSVFRAELLTAYIGLAFAGLLLCWAFVRTGSIYMSFGLHAGFIVALKLVVYTSNINLVRASELARRYVLVSTWLTWVSFGVIALLIYFITLRKSHSKFDQPFHAS